MMSSYAFNQAMRGWRASPALTALIVLALGLGIAACMTTLTMYHVLAADPIPAKSARLFNVQLDAQPRSGADAGPNLQLTRFDAEALIRDARAPRQVMMSGGSVYVRTESASERSTRVDMRRATADVFALFDIPITAGSGWTKADDEGAARVAVVTTELAERLFGQADAVGRTITLARVPMDIVDGMPSRIGDAPLRVIGVVARGWRPAPHYFDLTGGAYTEPAALYLPFSTATALNQETAGRVNCWSDAQIPDPLALNAPCDWVQYWVELAHPADAPAFLAYLNDYSRRQKEAGRFERAPNARLTAVMPWLVAQRVIPTDVTLQVLLALGFLLVCVVNAVSLLLSRTLRRRREIGIRRALGATRGAIALESLAESALLGLGGAALGLSLTLAGLWAMRQGHASYAALAHMDAPMALALLAVAIGTAVLAGLWPAWRAAQVNPALQVNAA